MREIDGYKIDGRLFLIPLITSLILLSVIVYFEGLNVFLKTNTYTCPEEHYLDCYFFDDIILSPGEIIVVNNHNNVLIQIFNYVPWVLLFLVFVVNHYKHNRH